MLKKFNEIGCKTSVLFVPIIPFISDDLENLDEIFRITKEFNLGSINAWPLHLRGNTKKVFFIFLQDNFSDLLPKFKKLYQTKNASKEYCKDLFCRIEKLKDKYQLPSTYTPTESIKKPIQTSLFD